MIVCLESTIGMESDVGKFDNYKAGGGDSLVQSQIIISDCHSTLNEGLSSIPTVKMLTTCRAVSSTE